MSAVVNSPRFTSPIHGLRRIALVAPLAESVPPLRYGGTERVVAILCDELCRRGYDVTLYASGDSRTAARLRATVPCALRSDSSCREPLPYLLLQLEQLIKESHRYDLIHFHEPFLGYSAARRCLPPSVTTMHGRLDIPDYMALQREFRDLPLVSVSQSQQAPMPWANWVATIYHGYDPESFRFSPSHSDYLVFLGRISPEKRPDRAIEIATAAGRPLRIAAKVDRADAGYFDARIRPLLKHPLVEFLGEVTDMEKQDLLGGALGLLMPIDWPEPFGLTMIEAMACGTPTIAFDAGSVPEIIENGRTGYIVNDMESAVARVRDLSRIDRARVRASFEKRFTARRMVDQYCEVYERLISTDAGMACA